MKTGFKIDVLTSIPLHLLGYVFPSLPPNILKLVRLLRVFRLFRQFSFLENADIIDSNLLWFIQLVSYPSPFFFLNTF